MIICRFFRRSRADSSIVSVGLWRKFELSFFFDTALPPHEDYVQVDCGLKPRYKKCTEKEKIKMTVLQSKAFMHVLDICKNEDDPINK